MKYFKSFLLINSYKVRPTFQGSLEMSVFIIIIHSYLFKAVINNLGEPPSVVTSLIHMF